ncbi:MAG: hypothetical protein N4A61_01995 [Pelagimonas sp.]|jgi:hypothetical protein|nr:hypothetical protein [Pelagimonas sp.]
MSDTQIKHRLILIPGQKKSGTTSLHSALAQVCGSVMDVPKESGILALKPSVLEARLARETTPTLLLDATTTYFRQGAFPKHMAENVARFDQVTVLLMVRPEQARLSSHYRHAINFDGWSGSSSAFLESHDYLDHADLGAMVQGLRDMGLNDIRMIEFGMLKDPDALRSLAGDLLGEPVGPIALETANSFGSREVIPGPIEALVAKPVFQVILRPLMPQGLRRWVKGLLGRKPAQVATDDLSQPEVQALVARIDASNARLRSDLEAGQ